MSWDLEKILACADIKTKSTFSNKFFKKEIILNKTEKGFDFWDSKKIV